MEKKSKSLFTLMLMAILVFGLTACGKNQNTPGQPNTSITEQAQTPVIKDSENTGLWDNAIYLTDTELGQGSKNLRVEVKAGEKLVIFTIHTDESTVGAALQENNLIAGEQGSFGLYVKEVNGIIADYDVNQSYWAFFIDGEYATAGVDGTDIAEESVYRLEYSK